MKSTGDGKDIHSRISLVAQYLNNFALGAQFVLLRPLGNLNQNLLIVFLRFIILLGIYTSASVGSSQSTKAEFSPAQRLPCRNIRILGTNFFYFPFGPFFRPSAPFFLFNQNQVAIERALHIPRRNKDISPSARTNPNLPRFTSRGPL